MAVNGCGNECRALMNTVMDCREIIMYRSTTKAWIATMLTVCMLLLAGVALAQEEEVIQDPNLSREPTAGEMLIDLSILRPLGLVGTALGVVTYVIALPFTLPTKSAKKAGEKLVMNPVKYTFTRPLGQMEIGRRR